MTTAEIIVISNHDARPTSPNVQNIIAASSRSSAKYSIAVIPALKREPSATPVRIITSADAPLYLASAMIINVDINENIKAQIGII